MINRVKWILLKPLGEFSLKLFEDFSIIAFGWITFKTVELSSHSVIIKIAWNAWITVVELCLKTIRLFFVTIKCFFDEDKIFFLKSIKCLFWKDKICFLKIMSCFFWKDNIYFLKTIRFLLSRIIKCLDYNDQWHSIQVIVAFTRHIKWLNQVLYWTY